MRIPATLLLLVALVGCVTPGPAATPPPPASSVADPTSLDELPVGPPPRIGYVVDHRFVGPGGLRHPLPRATGVVAVARLGDGFLVQDDRNFEGYAGLALIRRGRQVEGWSTAGAPAVGLGGAIAWGEATTSEASVQPPPMVRLEVHGVRLEQRVDLHPSVVGIIGRDVIYNAMFAPYPNSPRASASDLISPPRKLDVRYVADVDEVHHRVLAQRGHGLPAVMDYPMLDPLWDPRGRGFELQRFNPTGGLILAQANRRELVVLDSSSGTESGRITLPEGVSVAQSMWESDRTVLLVVERGRETAVIRATRSGQLELAVPPMRLMRSWIGPGLVLTERR